MWHVCMFFIPCVIVYCKHLNSCMCMHLSLCIVLQYITTGISIITRGNIIYTLTWERLLTICYFKISCYMYVIILLIIHETTYQLDVGVYDN